MQSYQELKIAKIKERLSNPDRAKGIEAIINVAEKMAKDRNDSVTEEDLFISVKKNIKDTENAIDLIESKNGDATKWKRELEIFKTFLPPGMSSTEMETAIALLFSTLSSEEKTIKNMGKIISSLKKIYPNADMGYMSRRIKELLS